MGIFDSLYPQYSSSGLLNFDPQQQYNYQGVAPGMAQAMLGGSMGIIPGGFGAGTGKTLAAGEPSSYIEPDPSGSTPMAGPVNYSLMPSQTATVDTGSYQVNPNNTYPPIVPAASTAAGRPILNFRNGSVLDYLFGNAGQPSPRQGFDEEGFKQFSPLMQQPAQPQMPQYGVPLPTPRPQMSDMAPNGLDRNMTALPQQFASMDGTNQQNRNFPGYLPSPSALDAISPNAQLASPARQPVSALTQEAPQSRGGLSEGFRGLIANADNGPIGALLGGIAGFAGMRQGENQTVKALVAGGLDPGMAQTVAKDPQLLRAILPNLMGNNLKATYGVISKDQFGNEQYGWIDPRTQTTRPGSNGGASASLGGGADAGFVTGPDGKPIAIPPGVDPKEFRRKVSDATADAMTGKRTEVQQKSDQFASRMELAEKNVKGTEDEGVGASGAWNALAGELPIIGATMQGEKYQKYEQSKRQFITALLRQESGAAIGKSEFDRYDKEFFPQPGNNPEIIAQKRESRRVAIDAMRRGAGGPSAVSSRPSGVTLNGLKWGAE